MTAAAWAALLGLVAACDDGAPAARTLAGTGTRGYSGDGGPATAAQLDGPFAVAYDRDGHLFFSDTSNHAIRRIDARTGVITTVAGTGQKGFDGDGGPATKARFDEPYGVVVDQAGNLFVADRLNRRVRRIDGTTGVISTLAGVGRAEAFGDGGPAATSGLVEPNGLALDRDERRLSIADVAGCRVRVVDLTTLQIHTFAGDGRKRHAGDGGPAEKASIAGARAVATAPDGALLILEREGNTLRRVDPGSGTITTIAGTGKKGYTGDGGPAQAATFNGPKELAVAADGTIAVVDTENHAIRLIDPKAGTIRTGFVGLAGGRGEALRLDRPHGVAFAPSGAIVIGDTNNHQIRAFDP